MRLNQVFRQAATSAIVSAAHQINRGYFPTIEPISDIPETVRGAIPTVRNNYVTLTRLRACAARLPCRAF